MRRSDVVYLGVVAVFAVALAGASLHAGRGVWRTGATLTASPTGGRPRDVDVDRVQRLMAAGALSTREALHYSRPAEAQPPLEGGTGAGPHRAAAAASPADPDPAAHDRTDTP